MGSTGLWQWVWLITAVIFAVGSAGTRRSVVFAPLAVAAGLAFVVLMFGQSPVTALIVFVLVAAAGCGLVIAGASEAKAKEEPRSTHEAAPEPPPGGNPRR